MRTHSVPSMVTAARLGAVPVLFFLVEREMLFYGALLFLVLLCTDLLDGYLARKLEASSSFGAHFDAATDFGLAFSVLVAFDSKGFVPDWVLAVVTVFYVQFLVTSLRWGRVYDPLGKYYGSLLFGAIGLRFLFSGEFFYDIVTFVITGYAVISASGRLLSLGRGSNASSSL